MKRRLVDKSTGETARSLASSRSLILICIGLAILTLAIYAQVWHFEFVNYDDGGYVYENPHVRTGLSLENIKWAFTSTRQSNWHPLTWISLMVDASIGGTNAGVYHLHNVILHVISTILLFLLLVRITAPEGSESPATKTPGASESPATKTRGASETPSTTKGTRTAGKGPTRIAGHIWRSAFVAALFAIHPLHVESVAWVAERKDTLSTVFWMLTMWGYVLYVARPRALTYIATLAIYALGLLAKPMLVTLPIVLIIARGWGLGVRSWGREPDAKRPKSESLLRSLPSLAPNSYLLTPLLVLAAASCVVTYWAQSSGGAVMAANVEPLVERVQNALVAYAAYILAMVWPAKLAVFYPMSSPTATASKVPWAVLLLAAISIWTYLKRKRFPFAWTGWMWYLITLVPVIGLVQVGLQARADRYTYIPLIGLFVAIAWIVPELVGPRLRRMLWVPAVLIVAALSFACWKQVGYWQNSITLAQRAVDAVENNYVGHLNLALAYKNRGDYAAALDACKAALVSKPDYDGAHSTLASLLLMDGDVNAAMAHLREAIRLSPDDAGHRAQLGALLIQTGKLDEGVKELREALRLDPDRVDAHCDLAYGLMMQRHDDEARQLAERARKLDPALPDAPMLLGLISLNKGQLDSAEAYFRQALSLDPKHVEARINLGVALFRQQRYSEAAKEFEEAQRLAPSRQDVQRYLAEARTRCGRTEGIKSP